MDIDLNNLFNLVAEGKLSVDQINYMLNSFASMSERIHAASNNEPK